MDPPSVFLKVNLASENVDLTRDFQTNRYHSGLQPRSNSLDTSRKVKFANEVEVIVVSLSQANRAIGE